jgi:hypothetical protein
MLRKKLKQAKGIDCCRFVLISFRTIVSDNLKKALSRRDAVVCRLYDTLQKELNPAFPVTMCTDSAQPFIVLLLVTFETKANIQQWRRKESPLFDEQRNQQPANASVTVEKRVNCLKLHMGEPGSHKGWQRIVAVNPLLQCTKAVWNFVRWWWHKSSVSRACPSDPVLRCPHHSWLLITAASASHQSLMNRTQQSHTQWQPTRLCDFRSGECQSIHVIADFFHIRLASRLVCGFPRNHIFKRGLCAFSTSESACIEPDVFARS